MGLLSSYKKLPRTGKIGVVAATVVLLYALSGFLIAPLILKSVLISSIKENLNRDANLDRLQEIHGIQFDYDANRLRYEDDVWHIEPSFPNAACGCGTGTCKRGRIDAFRGENPGVRTIHIGNGRVSDLCGALAADVAFAKGSLAEALAERGHRFVSFETLHDVVRDLERMLEDSA